jgi:TetR/AcrR family transcriptional repressor of nem operon
MKLFWARGYGATSLPDLLAAMGIARSSFYSSFGDKRSLFRECLELFGQRTLAILEKDAESKAARDITRDFFENTLFKVSHQRTHWGCLMVNSVLELAEVEPQLQRLAQDQLENIQQSFARTFSAARERGELPATAQPAELAALVMTINQGLRVQSRKQVEPEELRSIVDNSLSLLGLAA